MLDHSFYFLYVVVPKILPFHFGDEPSYLGESNTAQCSLSVGDLPVKFYWTLNGQPLKNIQDVSVSAFGKKTSVINIDPIAEHHAGNYTCTAKNKAGIARFSSQLVVRGTLSFKIILHSLFIVCYIFGLFNLLLVPPKITAFYFEGNPLHSGQYVQVNCLVSEGDLPIDIKWRLNEQDLDNYPEVSITKVGKRSSLLTIEAVSYATAGNYSCSAKNKAGNAEYVTQLQVNGL